MNHQQFVEHNVRQQLLKEGFSAALANIGASRAVQHYRRLSQASKRGDLRRLFARGTAVGREVEVYGASKKNHGARYHASANYSGEVLSEQEP